jgi:hypothetical protein
MPGRPSVIRVPPQRAVRRSLGSASRDSSGANVELGALQQGIGNRAVGALLQRAPEWWGASYARHGPETSGVEQRRASAGLGDAGSIGEAEAQVAHAKVSAVRKLTAGAELLYEIAAKARKEGSGVFNDDEGLLHLADRTTDAAKVFAEVASGLAELDIAPKGVGRAGELAGSALGPLNTSVKVLRLIGSCVDSDDSMAAFLADPNETNAAAWASSVGAQFDAIGDVVAMLPLPPIFDDYVVGVLKAPAKYIAAFQRIMSKHYEEIDKAADLVDGSAKLEMGGEVVWKGPLGKLLQHAAFDEPELYSFIIANRDVEDLDLQKLEADDAIDLLISLVARETDRPRAVRDRWIDYLSSRRR